MTEIYYECPIHGRERVNSVEIGTVPSGVNRGVIETIYKLECGHEVVHRVSSTGNAF